VSFLKHNFGVKEISFYDDVFTLNRRRVMEICDGFGKDVIWSCESRINLVDREMLQAMKKAGCYSIAYGLESGSNEILGILDKQASVEQAKEAVSISKSVGLDVVGYFMIGSPGETSETIRATIDMAKSMRLDYAQFTITTPFPGTKLYEMLGETDIPWSAFSYGGIGKAQSPMFTSAELSSGAIQGWVRRAYKEFYLRPSYIWRRLLNIPKEYCVDIDGVKSLLSSIK